MHGVYTQLIGLVKVFATIQLHNLVSIENYMNNKLRRHLVRGFNYNCYFHMKIETVVFKGCNKYFMELSKWQS